MLCLTDLPVLRLDLLQRGQHEDRRLAHTGLGLAQDVHAEHGLRDALVLHCKERRKTYVFRQLNFEFSLLVGDVADPNKTEALFSRENRGRDIRLRRGFCLLIHTYCISGQNGASSEGRETIT